MKHKNRFVIFIASVCVGAAMLGAALRDAGAAPIVDGSLKLWLKADAGVTQSGGAVSAWADQSGAGNHVSQANASLQPTLVAGAMNGQDAIRFGGDWLNNTTSNIVAGGGARTIFAVANAGAGLDGGTLIDFRRSVFVFATALWYRSADNTFYVYSDGVTAANNAILPGGASNLPQIQQPFVATFTSAGAGNDIALDINGNMQPVAQSPGSIATETGATGFTIGFREDNGGVQPWSRDIAEILVYDRVLTPAEEQQTLFYFGGKYAISVPEPLGAAVLSLAMIGLMLRRRSVRI